MCSNLGDESNLVLCGTEKCDLCNDCWTQKGLKTSYGLGK